MEWYEMHAQGQMSCHTDKEIAREGIITAVCILLVVVFCLLIH